MVHCTYQRNIEMDNLDDFEDTSRPPLTDWVEHILQGIFVTAGVYMIGYAGWLAVKAIYF